jgi:prepilin-type N-terminal cleavage/methylation domain-containing protein
MLVRCKQLGGNEVRESRGGFTLAEVLIATVIVTLFVGSILSGYVQADRMAEWSSMSLAAESMAAQGMEQARCAQWNTQEYPYSYGPGTGDELTTNQTIIYSDTYNSITLTNSYFGIATATNWTATNVNYALDVPATGAPFSATNIITITGIQSTPPLRMIRSDCVWTFPPSGKTFTNSLVSYRAPDQ